MVNLGSRNVKKKEKKWKKENEREKRKIDIQGFKKQAKLRVSLRPRDSRARSLWISVPPFEGGAYQDHPLVCWNEGSLMQRILALALPALNELLHTHEEALCKTHQE